LDLSSIRSSNRSIFDITHTHTRIGYNNTKMAAPADSYPSGRVISIDPTDLSKARVISISINNGATGALGLEVNDAAKTKHIVGVIDLVGKTMMGSNTPEGKRLMQVALALSVWSILGSVDVIGIEGLPTMAQEKLRNFCFGGIGEDGLMPPFLLRKSEKMVIGQKTPRQLGTGGLNFLAWISIGIARLLGIKESLYDVYDGYHKLGEPRMNANNKATGTNHDFYTADLNNFRMFGPVIDSVYGVLLPVTTSPSYLLEPEMIGVLIDYSILACCLSYFGAAPDTSYGKLGGAGAVLGHIVSWIDETDEGDVITVDNGFRTGLLNRFVYGVDWAKYDENMDPDTGHHIVESIFRTSGDNSIAPLPSQPSPSFTYTREPDHHYLDFKGTIGDDNTARDPYDSSIVHQSALPGDVNEFKEHTPMSNSSRASLQIDDETPSSGRLRAISLLGSYDSSRSDSYDSPRSSVGGEVVQLPSDVDGDDDVSVSHSQSAIVPRIGSLASYTSDIYEESLPSQSTNGREVARLAQPQLVDPETDSVIGQSLVSRLPSFQQSQVAGVNPAKQPYTIGSDAVQFLTSRVLPTKANAAAVAKTAATSVASAGGSVISTLSVLASNVFNRVLDTKKKDAAADQRAVVANALATDGAVAALLVFLVATQEY
jgi:hypothetical protein